MECFIVVGMSDFDLKVAGYWSLLLCYCIS